MHDGQQPGDRYRIIVQGKVRGPAEYVPAGFRGKVASKDIPAGLRAGDEVDVTRYGAESQEALDAAAQYARALGQDIRVDWRIDGDSEWTPYREVVHDVWIEARGKLHQALRVVDPGQRLVDGTHRPFPSPRLRYLVLERDSYTCSACGRSPQQGHSIYLHVAHITPVSQGGQTTLENLHTVCNECVGKADKSRG